MKPKKSVRSAFLLIASSAAFSQVSYSQTVEIDPVGAIPAAFTPSVAGTWDWNVDGDLESWTATNLTLDVGTPTSGSVSGTAITGDTNLSSAAVSIPIPLRTIVEFRLKKEAGDPSDIQFYWGDASGGPAAARLVTIPGAAFAADGNFKVVRITFPYNRVNTNFTRLRLDPINDGVTLNRAMSLDYMHVFTEVVPPTLSWDPDTVTTGAQGGAGTWDQLTTANWWDGSTNVQWPSSGSLAAFAGTTAGTVTVSGTVNANLIDFQTTGYTVTGAAINIGSDSAKISNSAGTVATRIDSQLTGSAPLLLTGGTFVLGGNNTSLSGPVTQASRLGITNDNAVGTGTLTVGAGGNAYITALDGDRTLANNVVFAGNRILIDNTDLGTSLAVGNLTINGSLALNCTAPGDFYLRKNLTVNGVVSGSNSNLGIILAGNAGTLRLTNAGNSFTGNITYGFAGCTIEADSNGALGNPANSLKFNVNGTLKMLAAFNSTHPIVINNFGTGTAGTSTTLAQFNTNGFDSTLTGTISAPVFSSPAVAQQITNFAKQGTGTLTLDSGGTTANNLRTGGIRVDGGTLKIASGAITATGSAGGLGVNGGSSLEINGGSLTTGNFSIGKSAGTATFTLNSGTYTNTAELLPAFTLGDGIININGGLANLNLFSMVSGTGLTSTMNLNGGEVRLNFFNARFNLSLPDTATSNINFNGSLVKAKTNQADFIETNTTTTINANVQAGGAIFDTNNFAITIKQPLVHDPALGATVDGGLTKNGLGTLTLAPVASPNTYTGTTTVNLGILEVSGTSINDLGKLDITGGQVLIPAAANEVVDTLFYNGVQQPAGVYGSSASTALPANQNDTYFDVTGTGTLTVNSGPAGNTYANWLASNPPATGFMTDSDNDGVPNGVENVLGTNPNVSSPGLTQVSATASSVTFQHTLNPTIASDVSYIYEWSSDLTEWKASGVANTAGTIGTIVASPPASGVVTVVTTQSGTASAKMFTRIKAGNP